MDVNMTEREQLQVLKDWWDQYGKMVLAVFIIALAGNFGWNYYRSNKTHNAEYASLIFTKMISSYAQNNTKEFKTHANYLAQKFPNVPYSNFANFALARQAVDDGQYDVAIQKLDEVINQEHSARFTQIARIRKARVLLAQKKMDEALNAIETVDEQAFMPLINEVRGDIFMAKGEHTKARTEYQAALRAMPTSESNRTLLQMKFDQLAGPENGIA